MVIENTFPMEKIIIPVGLFLVALLLAGITWLIFRHKQVRWANDFFASLMALINWLTRQTRH